MTEAVTELPLPQGPKISPADRNKMVEIWAYCVLVGFVALLGGLTFVIIWHPVDLVLYVLWAGLGAWLLFTGLSLTLIHRTEMRTDG